MAEAASSPLQRTPLHARHVAHGARMAPFAGWDMPVEYSGISAEHLAVRQRAGLFDVSHMGEVEIAGSDALAGVQRITSNDASRLSVGQAQYSALTTPEGTFVDDVLVYRWADQHFLLVVNAANVRKDYEWIVRHIVPVGDAVAVNSSARYALIALQGPAAREILQPLTGIDLTSLKYYWFAHGEVTGVRGTVSRTGYTGEDGYEVFCPPAQAESLWNAITQAGAHADLVPCGLGARDTLRLEAAMRLYGNDIDETTTVLEADLGWIVGWQKPDFLGADVLRRQKQEGVSKTLVGFEVLDPGIARPGCPVHMDGVEVGRVTSGTQTPFLKKSIGMAYVPVAAAGVDRDLQVNVRGRLLRARTVALPFYKRPKK